MSRYSSARRTSHWKMNFSSLGSIVFTCGYCDHNVASILGFESSRTSAIAVRICTHCDRPTYFEGDEQAPTPPMGKVFEHLPDEVESVHQEARDSATAGAFTAAVMMCRKLLMHIAFDQGAKAGKSFVEYVDFLDGSHFTPPNSKDWVDKIRKKGNESNHEIVIMNREDAQLIMDFSEMILTFLYEYPARASKDTSS